MLDRVYRRAVNIAVGIDDIASMFYCILDSPLDGLDWICKLSCRILSTKSLSVGHGLKLGQLRKTIVTNLIYSMAATGDFCNQAVFFRWKYMLRLLLVDVTHPATHATCSNNCGGNLDYQPRYIVFSLEQIGTPGGNRMRLLDVQSLPLVISVTCSDVSV